MWGHFFITSCGSPNVTAVVAIAWWSHPLAQVTAYARWRCRNVRNFLDFYSCRLSTKLTSLRDADAWSWHTWYSRFASTACPQGRSNGCLNPFLQVTDEGCGRFHWVENDKKLERKTWPLAPPSSLVFRQYHHPRLSWSLATGEPCNCMESYSGPGMVVWDSWDPRDRHQGWLSLGANYQPKTHLP